MIRQDGQRWGLKLREGLQADLSVANTWRWQTRGSLVVGAVAGMAAAHLVITLWPTAGYLACAMTALVTAGVGTLAVQALVLNPLTRVLGTPGARTLDEPSPPQAADAEASGGTAPDPEPEESAADSRNDMLEALVEENQRLMEAGSVDRRRVLQLEARLRALMEATDDTLVLTDAAGSIKAITDSASTLLRTSQSHATGSAFDEVVHLYEAEKQPMREHPLRGLVRRAVESQSSIPVMTPARLDDGEQGAPVIVSVVAIRAESQVIGCIVRLVTSDAREFADVGGRLSHKDANTDLLTRAVFERRVDELIEIAAKQECEHALVMLALDGLSEISSRFGLGAADETLWQTARILQDEIGAQGDCYRIGSDHFAVLVAFAAPESLELTVRRVRDRIDGNEFHWRDESFAATVSATLAGIDAQTSGRASLLETVGQSLIRARSLGGNTVVIAGAECEESQAATGREDRDWIEWLLPRLEDERTHLISQLAQPLVPAPERPEIVELFLRIEDDDGTWLSPGSFMPAIVRHNLSARVDQLVFERLLDALSGGQPDTGAIYSLNLSAQSMQSSDFREHVRDRLRGRETLAQRICFEVDEMVAASHVSAMQAFVETMSEVGVRCALDRCRSVVPPGSLRSLPLFMVKIHESLTRRMLDDRIDGAVLQWIAQANSMLGRCTVAMGVESEECLRAVEKLGMDYAQGVHVNKMGPMVL